MTKSHVFVETNFLFGVCRMPSKRHRDALALKAKFGIGQVKLYVPYLCFQEARNLIAKVDKSDLQPTSHRPKMTQQYNEAGLTFLPNFVLPVPPEASGA
jgi:hypothetical protein